MISRTFFYLTFVFIFSTLVYAINEPIMPEGDGTMDAPYIFNRYENFFWLSENVDLFDNDSVVYCKQVSDIDASDTQRGYDSETEIYYGWRPITTITSKGSFVLNYDGQGFSIINPYIGRSSELFIEGIFTRGYFRIKNVFLENVFLERGKTDYAGCLVGWIISSPEKNSSIENCNVSGTIKMAGGTGLICGGLIGKSNIDSDAIITISNCCVNVSISSMNSAGFIGEIDCSGQLYINNCSSVSKLHGNSEYNSAGGLIDNLSANSGLIAICNSYSDVSIFEGYSHGGGFINTIYGTTSQSIIEISNCYSTGVFPKNLSQMKPFLQNFTNSCSNNFTIVNCYYNLSTFGKEDIYAIGKTEDEMKYASTYENWDFENIWDINEGESLPYLKGELPEPSFYICFVFLALFGLRPVYSY